jgi:signal transduction histidine kinase
MSDAPQFRHLGGGRKGLFLLLRYLFIVAASYLLIFQAKTVDTSPAVMIAVALLSNVVLSMLPPSYVFAWYVEAPVMVADTLWVSWALHATGTSGGQEFFLLYFFVLFLAALGESLTLVLLGSTVVSFANVYFGDESSMWTAPALLRIVFFYTVALFYGHVLGQIKRERQRADRGFAWARELEVKVAERTEELRRLYKESLAASRLKSELVANMSHELRTPLNIILGYSEMLLDRGADGGEEAGRMVGRIRESARGLMQLVDSVLDLGKLESGKMPVVNQSLPLDRVARNLRERERMPLAPGVVLQWEIPPRLPVIESDQPKLTVILDNLINNAIKFTAAGRIVVTVRDLPSRAQVEFRVEDTGPGIDEEHLPTIFEPFHQLDGSPERAYGGVGLGLAIVQRYVTLLGGELKVYSRVGRGTSFLVTLPYRPHVRQEPRDESEPPADRHVA